jgi:hypothetical protein
VPDRDARPAGYQDEVARLAAEIAARLGPEPESDITAHLARIVAREVTDPGPALDRAHRELGASPGVPAGAGGDKRRAALAEAVSQLADEVAAHRRALEALLRAFADSFRPATHHHPDLEGELDALHDRLATMDRTRAWTPTDLDVITRLEALERAQRSSEG